MRVTEWLMGWAVAVALSVMGVAVFELFTRVMCR
jgi:hypothetical protein